MKTGFFYFIYFYQVNLANKIFNILSEKDFENHSAFQDQKLSIPWGV